MGGRGRKEKDREDGMEGVGVSVTSPAVKSSKEAAMGYRAWYDMQEIGEGEVIKLGWDQDVNVP